jgi:hypothetical protein
MKSPCGMFSNCTLCMQYRKMHIFWSQNLIEGQKLIAYLGEKWIENCRWTRFHRLRIGLSCVVLKKMQRHFGFQCKSRHIFTHADFWLTKTCGLTQGLRHPQHTQISSSSSTIAAGNNKM